MYSEFAHCLIRIGQQRYERRDDRCTGCTGSRLHRVVLGTDACDDRLTVAVVGAINSAHPSGVDERFDLEATRDEVAAPHRSSVALPRSPNKLRGLERFRILEENHDRSYRLASIEPLHERALSRDDRDAVRSHRTKLETMLAPAIIGGDAKIPAAMSDEDLVNALAQYLDLEPLEKQALLEQPCLRSRAESLIELLEMKIMMARTPGLSTVTH